MTRVDRGSTSSRQVGLRPVSQLPGRAKLLIVAACLAIAGFAAWLTVRLLDMNSRPVAILLIVLSYIGAFVLATAVMTATRIACSLGALPYLLGRGVRRLLGRR